MSDPLVCLLALMTALLMLGRQNSAAGRLVAIRKRVDRMTRRPDRR